MERDDEYGESWERSVTGACEAMVKNQEAYAVTRIFGEGCDGVKTSGSRCVVAILFVSWER